MADDDQIVLYRYDYQCNYDNNVSLYCQQFEAIKETPGGYWIAWPDRKNNRRWVAKNAIVSFAYADKKDALRNFMKRKRKQIFFAQNSLDRAKKGLELAEEEKLILNYAVEVDSTEVSAQLLTI